MPATERRASAAAEGAMGCALLWSGVFFMFETKVEVKGWEEKGKSKRWICRKEATLLPPLLFFLSLFLPHKHFLPVQERVSLARHARGPRRTDLARLAIAQRGSCGGGGGGRSGDRRCRARRESRRRSSAAADAEDVLDVGHGFSFCLVSVCLCVRLARVAVEKRETRKAPNKKERKKSGSRRLQFLRTQKIAGEKNSISKSNLSRSKHLARALRHVNSRCLEMPMETIWVAGGESAALGAGMGMQLGETERRMTRIQTKGKTLSQPRPLVKKQKNE